MTDKHSEHIEDEFLRKLLSQVDEEQPSPDFTDKVMQQLPRSPVKEEVESAAIKPWQWVLMAAGIAGVGYFLFAFDIGAILGTSQEGAGINYLNMFASIFAMFSEGFSAFKVTSITAVIIASAVLLYLADKFLKKWSDQNTHFA
ncbi:MAG: hypothetical protein ACOCX8_00300 [Bacteroidota bacterium]